MAETVTSMLSKIYTEVLQHGQRLNNLELRLLTLETESEEIQNHLHAVLQENRHLGDKVEDLENRSRCNNLQILGFPEAVPQKELVALCERELPTALGIARTCKVERAHQLDHDL